MIELFKTICCLVMSIITFMCVLSAIACGAMLIPVMTGKIERKYKLLLCGMLAAFSGAACLGYRIFTYLEAAP